METARVYREPKRKFALPWPFYLLGWALCIICILAGAFLMWAYAIQFGNDKTYQVAYCITCHQLLG